VNLSRCAVKSGRRSRAVKLRDDLFIQKYKYTCCRSFLDRGSSGLCKEEVDVMLGPAVSKAIRENAAASHPFPEKRLNWTI